MLQENGPYLFHWKSLNYIYNNYSWNTFSDILFVDQPIGIGYSIANNSTELCMNLSCVANDFYSFLFKYFSSHPEYKGRPLYISGESFAGHYIPAIAARIVRGNCSEVINLKGVAIGNPLVSLQVQVLGCHDYLLEHKFISYFKYYVLEFMSLVCKVNAWMNMDWKAVLVSCGDVYSGHHFANEYDIRETEPYDKMDVKVETMYRNKTVIEAVGGRRTDFNICQYAYLYMFAPEIARSLSYEVELLLEKDLEVMLYFGDQDYSANWRGGEYLITQ